MIGSKKILLPLLWIACLSTVVLGVAIAAPNCSMTLTCPGHLKNSKLYRSPLNYADLQKLARQITVQVQAGSISGSGAIFDRQGDRYRVITNAHNLIQTSSAQIRTNDGHIHLATKSKAYKLGNNDLAILEFKSSSTYQVAECSRQSIKKGDLVVAAGFEFDKTEITTTNAEVSHFLEQPLKRGYQLGYTNAVHQGMSGGPILDRTGVLIGVNAVSAYPLLNRIYVFADGSKPTMAIIKQMRRSNWGVPVMPYLEECLE
jgi:S1-C subfamily serine protease